jgi:hypothetical protein
MKEFYPLGRHVLKGDEVAILRSEIMPENSGAAFQVKNGRRLRNTGRSIVGFAAFNLHDLTERFD